MRIQYIEMQTPDGLRSAYVALPDGAYDENWKSSSITILREGSDEESVRDFIEKAQLQIWVDEYKCILGFPNPVDGTWHAEGKTKMTPDERFIQAFSSSALPSGRYSEGWRVMGDVHYLVGIGTGASLIQILTALYPTNSLAAAICTIGGGIPKYAISSATGSPVPAFLIGAPKETELYYLQANAARPVGDGKFVCDYNAMQRVRLCEAGCFDASTARIVWEEFFQVIRRVNTTPWGDVDRRLIPQLCGFEWHTDDACLGDNQGLKHSWIEHCPEKVRLSPEQKVPLVLFSHGMSDNPLKAADMGKLHELGEREGFITVYPFASNHYNWNLSCDPEKEDDMQYYEALIAYLCRKYPIDTQRIYLSGFSNGAGMAMTYAMLHPAQIAAIFPIDSTFPYAAMGHFRPAQAPVYITPVLKAGDKPPAPFTPPRSDPEKNLAPMRRALAAQEKRPVRLPVMYFYGTRESEYPIMSGSNQELTYTFWKQFNGIANAPTVSRLEPEAVGVPGQKIKRWMPDPAHPKHEYSDHTFFVEGEPDQDYYHFLLMHGKAHEVHPVERELGWAFVSRFRRNTDGSISEITV